MNDRPRVPGLVPIARIAALLSLAAVALASAMPVLAQEGGHEPISLERRLIAVGILVAFTALMVFWAWLYKRVNRGT